MIYNLSLSGHRTCSANYGQWVHCIIWCMFAIPRIFGELANAERLRQLEENMELETWWFAAASRS